ncbi:sensor histidine kinase [Williamsia sterculiae]|uniref:histidine kinase n=1 Tax=Williamsia sterculiae TaxID=1344003 RepID=A0A1N7FYT9_9NOCA|nr:PAS domain-containing sensor histidine kinase [Williamsia sterculiae]SIS05491.1 Two-component sensor histidine kinase, contains HisKA and HATPase domains [Williamsia sterculiae]
MSTLAELLAEHTHLSGDAAGHLQRVVAEWQLLADLSFADVVMYVRAEPTDSLICVAQCRPNTAPTVSPADAVGNIVTADDDPQAVAAFGIGRILREEDPTWIGSTAVRREAVPVRFRDTDDAVADPAVIAVLVRSVNLTTPRLPSPLELAYQDCAHDLCQMVCDGTFPQHEGNPRGLSTPRAGDGFVRIDDDGVVTYASPNALSAFHRMGWTKELSGNRLGDVIAALLTDPFESGEAVQMIAEAITGQEGMRIEADASRATVLIRAVPLRPRGARAGAAVLIRDVTEVKRRDRALISKDATIREIHHRVKNNLQSVSALLRLQSRRTDNVEARRALDEAVRRVASIALVHELLSGSVDEEVDLDTVLDQLIPVLGDVSPGDARVRIVRRTGIGVLHADLAMPLVMVLTEIIQNSAEHGFRSGQDGTVTVSAERTTRTLTVIVRDDGVGLPPGFDPERSDRLGLQIVHTLVRMELGGTLTLHDADGGGAEAVLTVPLH